MIYGIENKNPSFSMSLKITLSNPNSRTYGLFVEELTARQAESPNYQTPIAIKVYDHSSIFES